MDGSLEGSSLKGLRLEPGRIACVRSGPKPARLVSRRRPPVDGEAADTPLPARRRDSAQARIAVPPAVVTTDPQPVCL